MSQITVVGSGLAGCAVSILLSKAGHQVSVFEKRPDIRKHPSRIGKSINLAISERGWHVLKSIGMAETVRRNAIAMYGRMIHKENSSTTFQPYGLEDQCIYSVSRDELNKNLLDLAGSTSNVSIRFNTEFTHIDLQKPLATFANLHTGEKLFVESDVILGTDGVSSAVRNSLAFKHQIQYIDFGYKEIRLCPKTNNRKWDKHALHIWPRKNFMLIALPNLDDSFTFTLFLPQEGYPCYSMIRDEAETTGFFQTFFPDLLEEFPEVVDIYLANKFYQLYSVACSPWHFADKALLLGDACHTILPFYGQGANMALEDCLILYELLTKGNVTWGQVFKSFTQRRIPDASAIARLSEKNFIEMRDKVADPVFLLRKQIETYIGRKHPDIWIPLYTMISFTRIPYAEALSISEVQDAIIDEIMQLEDIEHIWESLDYSALLARNKLKI
jgi:kynurenine 3-monooxygenase